jgi:hypothetical protein
MVATKWMAVAVLAVGLSIGTGCDDGNDGTYYSGEEEESADAVAGTDGESTCVPDCQGLACGDDGCGGSCGECGLGEECGYGVCEVTCVPSCGGHECGDDGCGGSCGGCGAGEQCSSGKCMSACGACMEGSCGYELETCEGNYECGALLQCLSNCGTDSCANSCIYSYMGGADDLLALLECVDAYCSSKC